MEWARRNLKFRRRGNSNSNSDELHANALSVPSVDNLPDQDIRVSVTVTSNPALLVGDSTAVTNCENSDDERRSPSPSLFSISSWRICPSTLTQNSGFTTLKAFLITLACVLFSIFVIVPFLTSSLWNKAVQPTRTRSPSITPTLSTVPSFSIEPTLSHQPSSYPSISHEPTISPLPSSAPSDPVPSSSPTWNMVSTQVAFRINETYPMNETAVVYYEDLLFDVIGEGFVNYTIEGNVTSIEMIKQDPYKDYASQTVGVYICEAISLTNFTNRDFNCLIRKVFNVTC